MNKKPLFELDVKEFEESIEKVKAGFDKAEDIALKAAKKEVINIVFDLLGEGMRRAPVRYGTLRGSGIAKVDGEQTAHTEKSGEGTARLINEFKAGRISLQQFINEIVGEVAFNTHYATRQHEDLSYEHPKGGEAKYLENPMKEKSGKYIKGLADAIEKALDREDVGL